MDVGRGHSQLIYQLNRERIEWRNRSCYDDLTGLLNQRYFFDHVPAILDSASNESRSLSLLMLDIDNFKSVNDNHGHPVGDYLLQSTGHCIQKYLRKEDIGFRLGGEEFAVIIHDASENTFLDAAERLRKLISEVSIITDEQQPLSRTVSIGVACLKPGENLRSLIKRSDNALYEAKSGGKDKVSLSLE